MPRGVYERKPKGDKPAAKKPAAPRKVTAKAEPRTVVLPDGAQPVTANAGKIAESMFGFQILGANITTLSEAYKAVQGTDLAKEIALELSCTIDTLKLLRLDAFSHLAKEEVKEKETKADVKPLAAVPSLPQPSPIPPPPPSVLPQGNSNFAPPAPPTMPQH